MASLTGNDHDAARQLEDLREQQRAISGVLRAVAGSAGLQPVLDEIVASKGSATPITGRSISWRKSSSI